MSRYKYVLWDWNGTLLNDLQVNIEVGDYLLAERGLPPIESEEFYLENFCIPVYGFYQKIGIELDDESYRKIADEYTAAYESRLCDVKLFSDAVETLDALNAEGMKQVIISATQSKLLLKQVGRYGISDKFEQILGTESNLGISKVKSALNWFDANGVDAKEVVFIGDTTHDCETANAIGCDCLLVARGHNSKHRLAETGCKVLDNLEEVRETISNK
ncbi:MAG: HAD family hydrolase [Faecalibacterium sp.]|nr:HAD family hydrolase [Ruminococcus sp.]MCM1486566.1 HAD family hydrolase [Faecalibacterium sp.]